MVRIQHSLCRSVLLNVNLYNSEPLLLMRLLIRCLSFMKHLVPSASCISENFQLSCISKLVLPLWPHFLVLEIYGCFAFHLVISCRVFLWSDFLVLLKFMAVLHGICIICKVFICEWKWNVLILWHCLTDYLENYV